MLERLSRRLFPRLARRWRVALDWVLTIAGAVVIVLVIKAWVVNPYRIPSSSMEPALHCAHPAPGCLADRSDRVLANRFIYHLRSPHRDDIVVFQVPAAATTAGCAQESAGETFVKRLIGRPGDRIHEDARGFLRLNGRRLEEPYVTPAQRAQDRSFHNQTWRVPKDAYFMVGDNRGSSCDSRAWGPVPRKDLIGNVFATYWPPNRISKNLFIAAGLLTTMVIAVAAYTRRRHTHVTPSQMT